MRAVASVDLGDGKKRQFVYNRETLAKRQLEGGRMEFYKDNEPQLICVRDVSEKSGIERVSSFIDDFNEDSDLWREWKSLIDAQENKTLEDIKKLGRVWTVRSNSYSVTFKVSGSVDVRVYMNACASYDVVAVPEQRLVRKFWGFLTPIVGLFGTSLGVYCEEPSTEERQLQPNRLFGEDRKSLFRVYMDKDSNNVLVSKSEE